MMTCAVVIIVLLLLKKFTGFGPAWSWLIVIGSLLTPLLSFLFAAEKIKGKESR